nr:50S ribosomal protein L6P [uncultured archaeon]
MAIPIPDGVEVEAANDLMKVKGPSGSVEKKFDGRIVGIKVENGEVNVTLKMASRRSTYAVQKTIEAHLKAMIAGVQKKFEKKLELAYLHFPVTLEVKGKEILIKNFLGEKTPRKTCIRGNVTVEVKGQEITVSGADKEDVGQTASNIVRATNIRSKDRRVFQDGIYYKE